MMRMIWTVDDSSVLPLIYMKRCSVAEHRSNDGYAEFVANMRRECVWMQSDTALDFRMQRFGDRYIRMSNAASECDVENRCFPSTCIGCS